MIWVKHDFWRARACRFAQWHRWFAWRPVNITGTDLMVWLADVERRRVESVLEWTDSSWEYRQ